jgi:hypothetical protein
MTWDYKWLYNRTIKAGCGYPEMSVSIDHSVLTFELDYGLLSDDSIYLALTRMPVRAKNYKVITESEFKNEVKDRIVFDMVARNINDIGNIINTKNVGPYACGKLMSSSRFSDVLRFSVYNNYMFRGHIDCGSRPFNVLYQFLSMPVVKNVNIEKSNNMNFRNTHKYLEKWIPNIETTASEGQKKLFYSDAVFILKFKLNVIIYIGGSPGDHIKYIAMKYGVCVINVDPRPMAFKYPEYNSELEGIYHMSRLYDVPVLLDVMSLIPKVGKVGIIWDVRSDAVNKELGPMVDWDNIMMMSLVRNFSYPMSLKFRFSYNVIADKRFYWIAAAAGSGKTTFATKFPNAVFDIDMFDKQMPLDVYEQLKEYRRSGDWLKHNVLRDGYIVEFILDQVPSGSMILCHHPEDPVRWLNQKCDAVVVLNKSEHNTRVERKNMNDNGYKDITELNYKQNIEYATQNKIPMISDFNDISTFEFDGGVSSYLLNGFHDIYPQVYNSSTSYENRVICSRGGGVKMLKVSQYNTWAQNVMLAKTQTKVESDLLFSTFINDINYLQVRFDKPMINLFSISNNKLSYDELIAYIRRCSIVTILSDVSELLYPGTIFYHDRYLTDKFGHKDYYYDIYRLNFELPDYYIFSVRDAIAVLNISPCGEVSSPTLYSAGGVLTNKTANCWAVFIKSDIIKTLGHYSKYQTWAMGQTNFTKALTPVIRREYGLDNDSLHILRRWAIRKNVPNATLIIDTRIDGSFLNEQGEITYIAVAGHLVNMLLTTQIFILDMRRYLDTLVSNFESASNNDFRAEERLYSLKMSVEKGKLGLWHSILEYDLAIDAYLKLCEAMRIKVNIFGVKIAREVMDSLKVRFPKFIYGPSVTVTDRLKQSNTFKTSDESLNELNEKIGTMFVDKKVKLNLRL